MEEFARSPPSASPHIANLSGLATIAHVAAQQTGNVDAPCESELPRTDIISITQVNEDDVLCGRGGYTTRHPGNVKYRMLVSQQQLRYLEAHRLRKAEIAREIVDMTRSRGGRFLTKNADGKTWYDVGDEKAREKTSQALREGVSQRRYGFSQKEGRPSPSSFDGTPDEIRKQYQLSLEKREVHRDLQLPCKKRKVHHPSYILGDIQNHPVAGMTSFPNNEGTTVPTRIDVINGKGKAIQDHPGNIRFRNIVNMHRKKYQAATTRKAEKSRIASEIVLMIRSEGGRFLQHHLGSYSDVGDAKAKEKVSHALRDRRQYSNTSTDLMQSPRLEE